MGFVELEYVTYLSHVLFELFLPANVIGFVLSVGIYVKAWMAPCHSDDSKWTGSFFYDLFMGVELNPRMSKLHDWKLFLNGRPGLMLWPLISLSHLLQAWSQQAPDYVLVALGITTLLHFVYTADFYWHEAWYLGTVDMQLDHLGFYMAWGDNVWVPFLYASPATIIASVETSNSVDTLSALLLITALSLGIIGYAIFRLTNKEKDYVRDQIKRGEQKPLTLFGHECLILPCSYLTADGVKRQSSLIASGFWGVSRHLNYFGDMLLSLGMCLGATAVCVASGASVSAACLTLSYAAFMFTILVHRVGRDERKMRAKYGKAAWLRYAELVPYKILPGVY
ncbi:MAG: hypothetical protein MHM6MM_001409 [Cercozoa sp. M6MM]